METERLVGAELRGLWIVSREIHKAWRDATTPDLASGFVNLELARGVALKVEPCEVEFVPGKYPCLGLDVCSHPDAPNLHRWSADDEVIAEICAEAARVLPARITTVMLWDALGEGPCSAISLRLDNGCSIVIRHVYPPMTLGIEVLISEAVDV